MGVAELWTMLTTHWKPIIALATPAAAFIGTAVAGYLTFRGWAVTYKNNSLLEREKTQNAIDLEKRKAELAFVSDQIRQLYGPLVSLAETRGAAFKAMMHGKPRDDYFDGSKLDPEELRQWRLWRVEVMAPLVEQMSEVILKNGHLLDGTEMPGSFLELMAHRASYKAVIKNWEQVIESDKQNGIRTIDEQQQDEKKNWWPVVPHFGVDNFPKGFHAEVVSLFKKLKLKQADLIKITTTERDAALPQ
jgi:hypothetical protein